MSIASSGQKIRWAGDWLKRRKLALASLLVIWVLLFPNSSQSQFIPSPCCAILSAGLGSVASAITNVGGGLNAIRSTISSIESFQRSIVWPADLIFRAKNVVGSVQAIFDQIRSIGRISVSSATLPDSQQLEQALLSGNTTQMDSVAAHYTAVYSSVPPPTNASPQVRDVIDMTDAVAQAAMKRAIAIDAIADLELQAADRLIGEVRAAAPGSAPIIEGGAAAWLVRANAYTQSALSELMRLRATDLANAGAELKLDAQHGTELRGNVTDALKRR